MKAFAKVLAGYFAACLAAGLVLTPRGIENGYDPLLSFGHMTFAVMWFGWLVLRSFLALLGDVVPRWRGRGPLFAFAGSVNATWFFDLGLMLDGVESFGGDPETMTLFGFFGAAGCLGGLTAWWVERRIERWSHARDERLA